MGLISQPRSILGLDSHMINDVKKVPNMRIDCKP
jgi:hypothetical protein